MTTTTKKPRRLGAAPEPEQMTLAEKPAAAEKKTRAKKTAAVLAAEAPAPAPTVGFAKMNLLDWHPNRPWRFILFTDLHVSAKTIDRALSLLAYVRECAVANEAHVICLGDFWDQRAALAVRQLDGVQRELERWREAGVHMIIIPGNHDQVSLDGSVNAVRIFDAFSHVHVVSEPTIDEAAKLAFIPWQEDAAKQQASFAALSMGTTIFAHAEVAGAIANSGKPAAGRVSLATIDHVARACYVGHYHKRQKLGEKAWYIGSPFEMNFGERDEPHGIALVTLDEIEPAFLDLDDFPKHYRLTWPIDKAALGHPRAQDVVELVMPERDLAGPALREALALVKAADVRPVLAPKSDDSGVPAIALSLDAAIEAYVIEEADGTMAPEDIARATKLGRELLAQVSDARTIVPYAPFVRVTKVIIDNFCAVKGHFEIDLDKLGPVLLRGAMGVGKTSICDAITWGLYGTTTPRKPGVSGGSLRADEVVHDSADEAHVRVCFDCVVPTGERIVCAVDRVKKRNAGAKVRVYGTHGIPEGVTTEEQQDVIHKLIGLDIDLWRACVYLGQGAVANFLTDGDKRRKELLSRAFGLGACEPALKLTRDHLKRIDGDIALFAMREAEARAGLTAIGSVDLETQAKRWDEQHAEHIRVARVNIDESRAHAAALAPHLTHEAAWLDRQRQYNEHIEKLARSLVASTSERSNKLAADLGGVQSERSMVDRDIAKSSAAYTKLIAARTTGTPTCDACGQSLPVESVEDHIAQHEEQIAKLQSTASTLAVRASNLANELEGARTGDSAQKESIRAQMEEARTALAKINEALAAIVGMKQAHADHARRVIDTTAMLATLDATTNPYRAQAADAAARRAAFEAALADATAKAAGARTMQGDLGLWDRGFSAKGVPVIVLRTIIHELETHANAYLARLLAGRIVCKLSLVEDDLLVRFFEWNAATSAHVERSYLQLSGGQRRCAELAFSPFALSEMIFARAGVRVSFLVVDELTTHLDSETKPIVCALLQSLDRETVLVIDHDVGVLGSFDHVIDVSRSADGSMMTKRGGT